MFIITDKHTQLSARSKLAACRRWANATSLTILEMVVTCGPPNADVVMLVGHEFAMPLL
jgi:hypothetical protein